MATDTQSATGAVAVNVSSGDQSFDRVTRGFFVGGAGNLAVTMEEGQTVTFTGLAAGQIYPFKATSALNSGTTATNVIALF